MPVPYNMQFELSIMSKLNDDALQIIEQILPYFQPAYNLSIELVRSDSKKKIFQWCWKTSPCKMIMREILHLEEVLLYTLRFCKNISVWSCNHRNQGYHQREDLSVTSPEQILQTPPSAYTAAPRATQNYTGDAATTLAADITKTARNL